MKDYFYKGFRYWYSKICKKWVVDTGESYMYWNRKQDAIDFIDFIIERNGE